MAGKTCLGFRHRGVCSISGPSFTCLLGITYYDHPIDICAFYFLLRLVFVLSTFYSDFASSTFLLHCHDEAWRKITTMAEHAPRRLPPGPSKLSQEVIADDPEEEPPLLSKDHLTPSWPIALNPNGPNSPSTPSFNYKTPYDVADEGVNVPLLPLYAPQTVRLPLTRNFGTEQIVLIDVSHSTGNERGNDNQRLSDYRWTALSPDDTEYDSPRRRPYTSSIEAQCAIEMPSPSLNYSYYFDTTPPFTSTLGRFPKPPARHPFAKNFEVPQWRRLAMHTGLCALSYPFLLIFVILGQGKTLFWSRLFVGAGCNMVGGMLSFSLVHLSRGVLEAASMWSDSFRWNCLIQNSLYSLGDGHTSVTDSWYTRIRRTVEGFGRAFQH